MANIVISIDPEGTATYLLNEHTIGLFAEATKPRRASHVFPAAPFTRIWFKALRAVFGEDGRIGNWTRSWGGYWALDMSPVGGPDKYCFLTRANAIEFEINWLNKNFLGRS